MIDYSQRIPNNVNLADDKALQRALEREGCAVAVAASAEQAFALAARQKPEVIFLDVRLPGMDGLTALARLRELAAGASTSHQ